MPADLAAAEFARLRAAEWPVCTHEGWRGRGRKWLTPKPPPMMMYRCSCGANANCPVCEPKYEPLPCECDGVLRPPAFLTVGPADYTALIVAVFASAIDEHDIVFLRGPWAETLCDLMDWDYEACLSYAALSRPERCRLIHEYRVVKGH